MSRRSLIVCNWKACLSVHGVDDFFTEEWHRLAEFPYDFVFCPSYPFLSYVAHRLLAFSSMSLGAQDVSPSPLGPYTGEVSAEMLADLGCRYVLLGHSDRRLAYQENERILSIKIRQVLAQKMIPILCVGESQEQRQQGNYLSVIETQLLSLLPYLSSGRCLIAYEPVWAVGQSVLPSVSDIEEVHAYLAAFLRSSVLQGENIGILYGGGLNESNVGQILSSPYVSGVLLGRASLSLSRLLNICSAGE